MTPVDVSTWRWTAGGHQSLSRAAAQGEGDQTLTRPFAHEATRHLLHQGEERPHRPVEPNPPLPRRLSSRSSTSCQVMSSTLAKTSWAMRKLAGKMLSVLRICKSSLTFDDPVDYALWKVQRHSGVTVTATERQRRYPLIFAWPLVWQLYRQGALK